MGIFEHSRFEVWNSAQHPYRHPLSDFHYTNESLPGVTNIESALNWLCSVLYPNTKPAVDTPADLPLEGNTLNDFRVVLDDGDGKAAAYRWEQREGELQASWHKVYDMDWGADSILTDFLHKTQDVYASKVGIDDRDGAGVIISGLYAGQRIFGGASANTNLTLSANSGDGTGANTGYVQFTDQVRPVLDALVSLGTASERFKDIKLSGQADIGTLTLKAGSIEDSGGAISFGANDLSTTGDLAAANGDFAQTLEVATMLVGSGSITDTTGAIDFGDADLSTSGTVSGAAGSVFGDVTLSTGQITSAGGAISFDANNLTTTGTLAAGNTTLTRADVDDLRLDGAALSVITPDTSLTLEANGTGKIIAASPMLTLDQDVTGLLDVSGTLAVDNLQLDGNTIETTDAVGDLYLRPNASGAVVVDSDLVPFADNTFDLGESGGAWYDLHLGGSVHSAGFTFAASELMALRSTKYRDAARTQAAQTGDILVFDSADGVWLASHPDSEIAHSEITGLTTGDAGHTQFAMLAGRAGGQVVQGGTGAGEALTLESTGDATKGAVQTRDVFRPEASAAYSSGWQGVDLGDATHYWRHIFTRGELKGLRLENVTEATLPVASAQNFGRLAFTTDGLSLYADIGSGWKRLSSNKYLGDVLFDGVELTKTVTVSGSVFDARNCIWALHRNATDYERVYCAIQAISATQVKLTSKVPLPAGSYRLIGLE